MEYSKNIDRIKEMENILNKHSIIIEEFSHCLDKFKASQDDYEKLSNYYSSQAWFDDLKISESKDFPKDINCGVLSEDAVFDLIGENFEIAKQLLDLANRILQNH